MLYVAREKRFDLTNYTLTNYKYHLFLSAQSVGGAKENFPLSLAPSLIPEQANKRKDLLGWKWEEERTGVFVRQYNGYM